MSILQVHEIFFSLQGESTHSGLPCVFVRLAGCPLRCVWCDTRSVREAPGQTMSIREILEEVAVHDCPLVEVTGGEPLVQPGTPDLCRTLLDKGYTVLLETSGAFDLSLVPADVRVIMDWKPPSSGEGTRMLEKNLQRLGPSDECKFVVADRGDFDAACVLLEKFPSRRFQVLFSPVLDRLEPGELARWLIRERIPDGRLQVQLHRIGNFA